MLNGDDRKLIGMRSVHCEARPVVEALPDTGRADYALGILERLGDQGASGRHPVALGRLGIRIGYGPVEEAVGALEVLEQPHIVLVL
jgi:hypothetical protein